MANRYTVSVILEAFDKASATLNAFANNAEDKLGKVREKAERLNQVGTQMTLAGGAIAGALGLAAQQAVAFEEGMVKALSISGKSGAAYKALATDMSASANRLAEKMIIPANQINDAFYSVVSATGELGTKSSEALTVASLKLSRLSGDSTDASVKMVSGISNAFTDAKGKILEYGRTANVVFTASAIGAAEVPELADSLRIVGTTAAGMNKTLEETSAVLVGLSNVNIKGAEAGTALKQIMVRLAAPSSKEAVKTMKHIGFSAFDSQKKMKSFPQLVTDLQKSFKGLSEKQRIAYIETIAGSEAMKAMGGFLSMNANQLREYQRRLEKQKMLDEAFANAQETMGQKLKLVQIRLQRLVVQVGNATLPIITKLVDKLTPVIDKLTQWIERNPKLTVQIVTVAAALSGFLLVGGGMAIFVGQAITGLSNLASAFRLVAMSARGAMGVVMPLFGVSAGRAAAGAGLGGALGQAAAMAGGMLIPGGRGGGRGTAGSRGLGMGQNARRAQIAAQRAATAARPGVGLMARGAQVSYMPARAAVNIGRAASAAVPAGIAIAAPAAAQSAASLAPAIVAGLGAATITVTIGSIAAAAAAVLIGANIAAKKQEKADYARLLQGKTDMPWFLGGASLEKTGPRKFTPSDVDKKMAAGRVAAGLGIRQVGGLTVGGADIALPDLGGGMTNAQWAERQNLNKELRASGAMRNIQYGGIQKSELTIKLEGNAAKGASVAGAKTAPGQAVKVKNGKNFK